jgi:prepilin-type N-terminal cleavage/methylation domain-containing protein
MKFDRKGFTLIEVIVVVGIIAILAAILVPFILKEIDKARITRAAADIRSISTALLVMKKDTASWPTKNSQTTNDCTTLFGQGNAVAIGNVTGWRDYSYNMCAFDDSLSRNTYSYDNWKGPYMAIVSPDPWGNMYMCNIKDINTPGVPVWIISGGPNGTIDTSIDPSQINVVGDDIGIRIK